MGNLWKRKTVELRQGELEIQASDLGAASSVPDLMGEAILQNGLKFQLEEEDEIFEGYGRRENVYPYRQQNTYGNERKKRTLKTMELENRYLKAVFLPELGGRLWSLTDKETGKNLLYTNDVLQFRNLAVRNAWFSGGVEWNIGVIGHTPFTAESLYTAVLDDGQEYPVLRMYEYERIRKVWYQMDFWLEEEEKFLNCRMRIVNESAEVVPMYWWSNMAVPEYAGGRVIVPADRAYTVADGTVKKVEIPIVDGVDVTHYNQIPLSVDYFFEIRERDPKYIANVDQDGYGLLQISTDRLRSRKLFSWGHSEAGKHWQEFLTKDAGDYVEIQAGLAKTQYGCLPMAPHTAWEWIEQYGPVQIPAGDLDKDNAENSRLLLERLIQEERYRSIEEKLKQTKAAAKTRARLLMPGSGYGALVKQGKGTEHLEFKAEDEGTKQWAKFQKTRTLHLPDPAQKPDAFFAEDEFFFLLEETVKKENEKNWYAHYQLGVMYCAKKAYKEAKRELKRSYELAENAWSCHGLACTYFLDGDQKKAVKWMKKGLSIENKDASYLKEAFRILYLCEAYGDIEKGYRKLHKKERKIARLKFYDIAAKYHLGRHKEALSLLEEDGGFLMEDIREGEESLEAMWAELCRSVYGEDREVPYCYRFKAF